MWVPFKSYKIKACFVDENAKIITTCSNSKSWKGFLTFESLLLSYWLLLVNWRAPSGRFYILLLIIVGTSEIFDQQVSFIQKVGLYHAYKRRVDAKRIYDGGQWKWKRQGSSNYNLFQDLMFLLQIEYLQTDTERCPTLDNRNSGKRKIFFNLKERISKNSHWFIFWFFLDVQKRLINLRHMFEWELQKQEANLAMKELKSEKSKLRKVPTPIFVISFSQKNDLKEIASVYLFDVCLNVETATKNNSHL